MTSFFSSRSFSQPATEFQFSNASSLQSASQVSRTTPVTGLSSVGSAIDLGSIVTQVNPNLVSRYTDVGSYVTLPGGTFTTLPYYPPQPTPPQPAASQPANSLPTNVPSQLLALLAAIPIATDGRVITSEYHNSLRAAVLALAGQLGVGLITPTVVVTLTPNFLPDGGANNVNWRFVSGAAVKPDTGNVVGVLPLQLPEGSRLQSLTVFGTRGGSPSKFEVRLVRQSVTVDSSTGNATTTPLMSVDLRTINSPFNASTNAFMISGLNNVATAATTEDYKTIANADFKYLLFAELTPGDGAVTAQINAIQLTYQPGLAG